MKKIIIAIVGIIISLLFCSCEEITNIGKVHKYPLYPDPPSPPTTLVQPDSIYWLIIENYPDSYYPSSILSFPWGKKMKFNRNTILIDTLTETPVISVDLQIESTFPDISMQNRKDRVSSFRIKLDSIELSGSSYLNTELSTSNWFEVYLKTLNDQKIYYLNQNDLKVDWMFAVTSEGILSGYFIAWIPNNLSYQTQLISINFDLYYPYKKNKN